MSYDDNNRAAYGREESHHGTGEFASYQGRGGEADEYYNEGESQSGIYGSGRRHNDGTGRQAEYYGQESAGRYDDNNSRGYGAGRNYDEQRRGAYGGHQGGEETYDNDGRGGGHGTHQGGRQRNDDDNLGHGYGGTQGGHESGGGFGGRSGGYNQDEVINHARRHGKDEDINLFSQAMSFLGENKHSDEDLDEQRMIGAHQNLYGNKNNDHPHDANGLGAGAAMQALKMFTNGGGGAGGMGSQGHGNSQSQFIGMAMAQAGKLFDQKSGQGKVASGADKQSAVNAAAKLALQMYMKSEGQGGGGGPGGLMGLASKFM